jgi:hypothetical protein
VVRDEDGDAGRAPEESLRLALMHVACAWVAVAREEEAAEVDIQPLGRGVYECGVRMASGAPGVVLRVAFTLDAGLRLGVVAEPVRPG